GVRAPTMMHDFAITERHVVFFDQPVVFDRAMLQGPGRGMPFRWSDDYPCRIGLMPLRGRASDTKWYDASPGYAFHMSNAHDDSSGRVVIEGIRYDHDEFEATWGALGGPAAAHGEPGSTSGARLWQWAIDESTEKVA